MTDLILAKYDKISTDIKYFYLRLISNFMKKKILIQYILLSPIIFLLTGCDMVLMNPKGVIGYEEKKLILIALVLMSLIVIPVICITIVFAKKYSIYNNAIYKPNWAHSKKIEIICWSLPIIIIIILATITYKSTYALDPYKPILINKKSITIQVISSNWKWIFIYPEYNIATINKIVVPINIPITFKLTSSSVMNSFFIPALGSQMYVMPGMQTKLNLIANTAGNYKGFSSSYSGNGFSNMKFQFIAIQNINEFKKWIQTVQKSSLTLNNMEDFIKLLKFNQDINNVYYSKIYFNFYDNLMLMIKNKNHKYNFSNK
uniref:Ubiquinol oxidase subunit 2 n=1 Tax=Candidatus Aschnera chinzeii TaxID=1485666 RepID=A0AAT9G3Q8_9ENTR|nr:MAG: cytochrome o ubiquinol oxidase subunit II [Candidatus Aschnera chinzeii]